MCSVRAFLNDTLKIAFSSGFFWAFKAWNCVTAHYLPRSPYVELPLLAKMALSTTGDGLMDQVCTFRSDDLIMYTYTCHLQTVLYTKFWFW